VVIPPPAVLPPGCLACLRDTEKFLPSDGDQRQGLACSLCSKCTSLSQPTDGQGSQAPTWLMTACLGVNSTHHPKTPKPQNPKTPNIWNNEFKKCIAVSINSIKITQNLKIIFRNVYYNYSWLKIFLIKLRWRFFKINPA